LARAIEVLTHRLYRFLNDERRALFGEKLKTKRAD
jgi:hypothetical protein